MGCFNMSVYVGTIPMGGSGGLCQVLHPSYRHMTLFYVLVGACAYAW